MKANTFRNAVILANALVGAAAIAITITWVLTRPDDRWRIGCSLFVGIAIGFRLADMIMSRRFKQLQRDTDARYDQLLASVERERAELQAQLTGRHASH